MSLKEQLNLGSPHNGTNPPINMVHVEDAHLPCDDSVSRKLDITKTSEDAIESGQSFNTRHSDSPEARRLVRKVDLRLVLPLAIVYVTAFLDRSNLGNAYIAGLDKDLDLTVGTRYSVITMIFFVGYMLIDLPAAWIARKIGATVWIPFIAMGWGVLTLGQGFVKNWHDLLICRILLGFCEGGYTPAAIYLLSVWYTRYEVQKRYAGFFVLGIASSGLSGLLSYGIIRMDGDAGIAGWRWIYIIEGAATCIIAILVFPVLLDLPHKATKRNILGVPPVLTPAELKIMMDRIRDDGGGSNEKAFTMMDMLRDLRDWKVWEFFFLVMFNNTSLYAFSYFLPNILRSSLGYSIAKAQIMTFPPYAVGCLWTIMVAWFSDRVQMRGPFLVFNSALYIVGLSLTGFCTDSATRYAGAFLGVIAISANIPTNFGYQHNNTVGQSKRAICAAMLTMASGLGGVIAGNVFRSQDAPKYIPGLSVCMTLQVLALLIPLKNFYVFSRANKRADRGELNLEGIEGFRYTL